MSFTEACWLEDSAWKASCPSPVSVLFSHLRWKVQGIVPTLRFQHIFSILSVVVEQRFQVCFVMIGIGLRTDQGTIESRTDLCEQSVGQTVHGPESRGLNYVITVGQF